MIRTTIASLMLSVCGLTSTLVAQVPQREEVAIPIPLQPMTVYTIEVSSSEFRPSAILAQPSKLDKTNSDGSISGFFYTGQPSISGGQNQPTVSNSTIRLMPNPGQDGIYTLKFSAADGKPMTSYKVTIKAAVTR